MAFDGENVCPQPGSFKGMSLPELNEVEMTPGSEETSSVETGEQGAGGWEAVVDERLSGPVEARAQNIFWLEAEVLHAQGRGEAANHEAGSGEQDHGESDFANDQAMAHEFAARAGRAAAASFFEGIGEVSVKGAESGNDAEAESGEQRDGNGKTQNS